MYDYESQDDPNQSQAGAPGSDPYSQIRAIYQQITGGKYTPTDADVSQWGTNIDASYYDKIKSAIGNWWTQYQAAQPAPKPTETPNSPPPDGGGGGGGGGGTPPPDIFNAPLTKMYGEAFHPPTPDTLGGPLGLPPTPQFGGPAFPSIPKFQAPTAEEALKDPGYQFRLGQGADQLQNWAAARGTLNDSSTAKALQDYGQSAASQEYGNVYNRKMGEYNSDLATQYVLPYQAAEKNWEVGTVNPGLLGYSTQAQALQHGNDTNYLNSWNRFLNGQNEFYGWQNSVWNKLFPYANS